MIILSGSSGGLGTELLNSLDSKEKIFALYNKNLPKKKYGNNIIFERVDLCSEVSIENFINKFKKDFKNITLLHFAGYKRNELIYNFLTEEWEKSLKINLTGNFNLTRKLLPFMVKDNWGRIIHISSKGGQVGDKGLGAYSTVKYGIIGFSRVIAKEYGRFNITSNTLTLGSFKSGMFRDLSDKKTKELIKNIPSKTLGTIDNIVNAIEYLKISEFVNGSEITIDGGAY